MISNLYEHVTLSWRYHSIVDGVSTHLTGGLYHLYLVTVCEIGSAFLGLRTLPTQTILLFCENRALEQFVQLFKHKSLNITIKTTAWAIFTITFVLLLNSTLLQLLFFFVPAAVL